MAEVLRSRSESQKKISTISFLVVAANELCDKISNALHVSAKKSNCRIIVHQCEFITDALSAIPDLTVDFVVFTIDGRVPQSISEAETNISFAHENYFMSGRVYLVYCHGESTGFSITYYKVKRIAEKYSIRRLLLSNIADIVNRRLLAKRLLYLSEGVLGLRSGVPIYNI